MINWPNLKNNRCPKCGKDTALQAPFNYVPHTKMLEHGCGFKISFDKFNELVKKTVMKGLEEA